MGRRCDPRGPLPLGVRGARACGTPHCLPMVAWRPPPHPPLCDVAGWRCFYAGSNREFGLAAGSQIGIVFHYAAKEFKVDRESVLAAVSVNVSAFEHAAEELKADREFVVAAVSQNGLVLQHAAEEFKADRVSVLAAVSQ